MSKNKDDSPPADFPVTHSTDDTSKLPVIKFDYTEYTHLLENRDLTEDQTRELLSALWNIIVCFVDLGFGVQPSAACCGYLEEKSQKPVTKAADTVYLHCRKTIEEFVESERSQSDLSTEGVEA